MDKLKGAFKSMTIQVNAIFIYLASEPQLWQGLVTEQQAMLIILVGNMLLRFKTDKALGDR